MLVYWSVLQVLLIWDWFLRMTFILGFGHCKSSPFYINILGNTVDGRNPKQPVEVGSFIPVFAEFLAPSQVVQQVFPSTVWKLGSKFSHLDPKFHPKLPYPSQNPRDSSPGYVVPLQYLGQPQVVFGCCNRQVTRQSPESGTWRKSINQSSKPEWNPWFTVIRCYKPQKPHMSVSWHLVLIAFFVWEKETIDNWSTVYV